MFTLDEQDLQKSILGIGDGPAAFNAELTARGGHIISADPVYAFNSEQIRQRIVEIFDDMLVQVANNAGHLHLDKFGSPRELGEVRMQAMNRFLQDFDSGKQQGRYLSLQLPILPFSSKQFELALCSHFLFLYSAQFNLDFHIKAVLELCRVAKEVRLFPLLDLSHQTSTHLKPVMQAVEQAGFKVIIEEVDYEFQVGAKQMLRIIN